MLANAGRTLIDDGWAFEPKLDGWRALAHITDGGVKFYSRPGRDLTESVPHLAGLVDAVPEGTVVDGELVAGSGRAWSFYRLAAHLSARRSTVTFATFDLLALEGRSLLWTPYEERRRLLADLGLQGPSWSTLPAWTQVEVSDLLAACELQGLEGLVAKRMRSRYRPGRRSPDWVKVKTASWRSTHAPLRTPRR